MTLHPKQVGETLLAMLDGAKFANALRRNGKPCRIVLPDEADERAALIQEHLTGESATLTFHADGCQPWREHVEAVALAAFVPADDGCCRWVGLDFDALDHGQRGLADPCHALRCIAERADAAGLLDGVLVARSRGGRGRHVFLFPPEPVALEDAVLGVAALVADAFRIAAADVVDHGALHAFRRGDGGVARPGDPGAVELVPRATKRPRYGWALALPAAGAFAGHGGGVIIDPFTDRPVKLESVPRCDPAAWSRFVAEANDRLASSRRAMRPTSRRPRRPVAERIHHRTRDFLAGCVEPGGRNDAAFGATCNLIACGVGAGDLEQMILDAAAACGLPEREARAAIASARRSVRR